MWGLCIQAASLLLYRLLNVRRGVRAAVRQDLVAHRSQVHAMHSPQLALAGASGPWLTFVRLCFCYPSTQGLRAADMDVAIARKQGQAAQISSETPQAQPRAARRNRSGAAEPPEASGSRKPGSTREEAVARISRVRKDWQKHGGPPGLEPGTCPTLRDNHAT